MPALRPAVPDDLAAVESLVQDAYSPYLETIGVRPGPLFDDYADYIARGFVHVLEDNEALLALIVLIPETQTLLLDNIAVSPKTQKRGFGRLLMAFAEQQARDANLSAIRLYTHEKMVENQALYRAFGYVETHRCEDKGLARVFMTKALLP
ncbi:GNAT family N-acetyltransferase [Agrobacterium sp. a22-2]|uniref:GNAT family N-acetyltransferase n=1 Tax=Agrobacterium sp. a22-2 TaxID=2283840 RepID=UPI001447A2C6|nr:GNAT family N-acetyltransferase [Agrobacterium sp. a22-2]NKN36174.1 GNAT family N-acetyltransferase [Agrobacterium sp. a22-2]